MSNPGRPKKIGHRPWDATIAAQSLHFTHELLRSKRSGWNRKRRALEWLGLVFCTCYDPDNPASFVQDVAKALDGKLNKWDDDDDYKICKAYWYAWRALNLSRPLTWPEWKAEYKKQNDRDHLRARNSICRTLGRYGYAVARMTPESG